MRTLLILLTTLLSCFYSFGQTEYTYLRTGAVQDSWYTTECSIDTMLIEVMPKGLYAEVSMTMDFSTRGLNFNNSDSLEIQMMFQLPPDVEVTDMWLWIFGQPVPAGVYDRWAASQIYEEIVSRRTDPAILHNYTWNDYYSNTSITNLYKYNIFPMLNTMPRKCKITYQIPLRANGDGEYRVPLPMNVAQLSDLPIQDFKLRYYPGDEFEEPSLLENATVGFQNMGTYSELDLSDLEDQSLNIRFSTVRNATYLGVYDTPNNASDYFQFSVIPEELFPLTNTGKKTLVLFDYINQPNTEITEEETVSGFIGSFLSQFSETDSINILFSGILNQWVSEDWMVTDSATKSWIANSIDGSDISGYSNLTDLLIDAFQFITEHGNEGNIVLITNSNYYSSISSTNDFLLTINGVFYNSGIKIHVVDIDDVNTSSERFWSSNLSFYGNEYLLVTLSGQHSGEYWSIQNVGYTDALDLATSSQAPTLAAMDIHISRSEGFTHSSYSVGNGLTFPYTDQPIGITGVSVGSGDYAISCSAIENNGSIHQVIVPIPENEAFSIDTVTDNIWGGLKQRQMYGIDQTTSVIQAIIQNSKDYRVLSKYTAFLALEPAEGPLTIDNDNPFTEPTVGIDETLDENQASFSVYPNPFLSTLSIDISLIQEEELKIVLYDLQGKEIEVLYEGKVMAGNAIHSFNLEYLTSGVYMVKILDAKGFLLTTLKAIKN